MIKNLKLKNFRSFDSNEFSFEENINLIIGDNGKGKSNILEAIKLASSGEPLNNLPFESLVKNNTSENTFFVQGEFFAEEGLIVSDIAFDKETNKKGYFLNKKPTTRIKIKEKASPTVTFTPLDMNMIYLSPSLRRKFLQNTLSESCPVFRKEYKKYEEILKNRNSIIKNIREQKGSTKSDLNFWDKKLAKHTCEVYSYINELIDYYRKFINDGSNFFLGKFSSLSLEYLSKINRFSSEEEILTELQKRQDKDILVGKTTIGPHLDDFEIHLDNNNLINIASRGETKSVILGLKFLELDFIENKRSKKCILLVDDLISELDEIHKKMLLERIKNNQSIIANIFPISWENSNIIRL